MCTVYAPIAFLRVLWLGLAVFHVNGWCTKSQSVTFVAMNDLFAHHANIKVLGVGGAGGNAVNRMIRVGVAGVQFVTLNTDAQALELNKAKTKLHIGDATTRGLGAGGDPIKGEQAAHESKDEIKALLDGSDMVFITAGMGGGTGTGAAPIIAEMARSMGILTVGVVTKPFLFEGPKRRKLAEEGAARLRAQVDTLITVPNDRLLQFVDKRATMQQAFKAADDVLRQGVQGISDIILLPGIINVDFADVRAVLANAGVALMGLGRGVGEQRARIAAQSAANSPLLETSIQGAKRLLVNINAGRDFSIGESHDAMEYLLQYVDVDEAEIFMGHVTKDSEDGEVFITVLAAGMPENAPTRQDPQIYRADPSPAPKVENDEIELDLTGAAVSSAPAMPSQIQMDEIDLDIPAFLRRQRLGQ